MVIYTNVDKPGVIGYVGTILGKNKINIAAMQVGRKSSGGEAVTVVNVDADVPEAVLKADPRISRHHSGQKRKIIRMSCRRIRGRH